MLQYDILYNSVIDVFKVASDFDIPYDNCRVALKGCSVFVSEFLDKNWLKTRKRNNIGELVLLEQGETRPPNGHIAISIIESIDKVFNEVKVFNFTPIHVIISKEEASDNVIHPALGSSTNKSIVILTVSSVDYKYNFKISKFKSFNTLEEIE